MIRAASSKTGTSYARSLRLCRVVKNGAKKRPQIKSCVNWLILAIACHNWSVPLRSARENDLQHHDSMIMDDRFRISRQIAALFNRLCLLLVEARRTDGSPRLSTPLIPGTCLMQLQQLFTDTSFGSPAPSRRKVQVPFTEHALFRFSDSLPCRPQENIAGMEVT
jgi:hypothetical protein